MSDGHLFLGGDGVSFAGSVGAVWYDESHGSMLSLASPSGQLVEISLGSHHEPTLRNESAPHAPSSSIARSKSAPALAFEPVHQEPLAALDDAREENCRVVYDFTAAHVDTAAVVLMRLSLDRQFLAIQKSDVEVQILRLATGESYWIVCKSKPGNRILSDGVLWNTHATSPQSSQDLFLVTRLGIEQYRVSPRRRSCALHRTIAVYVHSFWYSAPHSVLIVSTGSRANELVPFHMQGASVEKLPRLVFSSAVQKRDLYLAPLYGDLFAVYGDSKTARLLLYRVTRDKVSCVRSLHLMLPAGSPVEFSVVDNLLVCHSVELSVSLFFDIKCDTDTHDPFSHPLPVSLVPPTSHQRVPAMFKAASFVDPRQNSGDNAFRSLRSSTSALDGEGPSVQQSHQEQSGRTSNESIVSPWRFLSPDFAQRSVTASDPRSKFVDRIEVRGFHLHLEQVSRSCAQHVEILPFLLRRGDQQRAKRLALGLIRERLEEQALAPAAVSVLLSSVQTVSGQDLDRYRAGLGGMSDESGNDTSSDDEFRSTYGARVVGPLTLRKRLFREGSSSFPSGIIRASSRNASGLTMIFQSEFLQYVWQPLLENSVVYSGSLSAYVLEYIRLLHKSNVPVETQTYMALAKTLVLAGKSGELYQIVQYHILGDSTDLADLLLDYGKQDRALRQLALDMYSRLGATTSVIQILLHNGEVDEAISAAWKYLKTPTSDPTLIPAASFFDAWVRSYSSRLETSTMALQQRLHSLLVFLRMWDGKCLLGEPSSLAQSASMPFPDEMVPESTRRRWRQGFGFPSR